MDTVDWFPWQPGTADWCFLRSGDGSGISHDLWFFSCNIVTVILAFILFSMMGYVIYLVAETMTVIFLFMLCALMPLFILPYFIS